MRRKLTIALVMVGILSLAAFLRFYGLNWDQNQHLHPDERFLTMVSLGIDWPKNFSQYLDADSSPLNPHNRGFGFFVYGTFPIFFTKWVAESLALDNYSDLTLIGRRLSALFDLGTVILVFLIGKEILRKHQAPSTKLQTNSKHQAPNYKQKKAFDYWKFKIWNLFGIWNLEFGIFPLLSMFFYSISVLPIQLSHFYAVDTYLTFFITLSFYLLVKLVSNSKHQAPNSKQISSTKQQITNNKVFRILNFGHFNLFEIWNLELGVYAILLGIAFGLALASKISALLFLPIIGLGLIHWLGKNRNFKLFFVLCSLFFVSSYFSFRLAQPYVFSNPNIFDINLNQKLLANWKEVNALMKPESGFPPSVQWIGTKAFLFPLASLTLWGLGIPLSSVSIIGLFYIVYFAQKQVRKRGFIKIISDKNIILLILIILWVTGLFFWQNTRVGPNIRYFIPIYPFLSVVAGFLISKLITKNRIIFYLIIITTLIWPLSFLSIYSRPHSRVLTSEWIYKNIPIGSTIANEHWDDGLPLTIDSLHRNDLYKYLQLPLYDADNKEKWEKVTSILNQSDYVILSSNRLWGTITKAPKRYPQASKYYKLLFNGSLGFEKIAEITSYPNLPVPLLNIICLYLFSPQEHNLGLNTEKGGNVRIDKCDLYQGVVYNGIIIRDDISEETFTVYDHPKVIIFKKIKPVDYFNILYSQ